MEVQSTTSWFEPSPLPFTHRDREAVTPTSIKENPQAALTPLKQVCEWASPAGTRDWGVPRRLAHRCQLRWVRGAVPALRRAKTNLSYLEDRGSIALGISVAGVLRLRGRVQGVVSVCVCTYMGVYQVYVYGCMHTHIYVGLCVRTKLRWAMR